MNKQVGYITSAHLILIAVAAGCFFIIKIPLTSPGSGKQVYDTVGSDAAKSLSTASVEGRNLFLSRCAACHNVIRNATGPRLGGLVERGPWADRNQLYKWMRNPVSFIKTSTYTRELKKQFGSMMQAFPDLSNAEIDAIVDYITVTNTSIGYSYPDP